MNILVTGASGFVGRNLCQALKNIQSQKDETRLGLKIESIYEYDVNTKQEQLNSFCKNADFVFHLAGVNKPKKQDDFMKGNVGFASVLLELLDTYHNNAPVMFASSIQATLLGRYSGSIYGKSKLAAEEIFFSYGRRTGTKVLVYRFPNLFGKWCQPNYNSVVATFCSNIANDLPINVNDPEEELELLYIDDLVAEMLDALEGKEHHCEYQGTTAIGQIDGKYCYVPITYKATLGEIADLINSFKTMPNTLLIPEVEDKSLTKKMYSTYLSYLPESKICIPLKMKCDDRGSFTELLKTTKCGQFSVNISKPGKIKGQHWHHSKWELFIVVSGHGLIQERKIGVDKNGQPYPVWNFEVSGDDIKAVHMLPGYTHNIINLSETENLITLMWANEPFDSAYPDTFYEKVE